MSLYHYMHSSDVGSIETVRVYRIARAFSVRKYYIFSFHRASLKFALPNNLKIVVIVFNPWRLDLQGYHYDLFSGVKTNGPILLVTCPGNAVI